MSLTGARKGGELLLDPGDKYVEMNKPRLLVARRVRYRGVTWTALVVSRWLVVDI